MIRSDICFIFETYVYAFVLIRITIIKGVEIEDHLSSSSMIWHVTLMASLLPFDFMAAIAARHFCSRSSAHHQRHTELENVHTAIQNRHVLPSHRRHRLGLNQR